MALINQTNQVYYEGNNYGDYQFVSLDDIINQFQIAYVGQDKIIPRIKRVDIAFHAMRALQELSFDTFKSIKSQEIVLPPSLKMILPQDYVNYTGVYWTDSSGIKHPIYQTKYTSNPFSILQDDDGDYIFSDDVELLIDADFESPTLSSKWKKTSFSKVQRDGQTSPPNPTTNGDPILGFGGGFKIASNTIPPHSNQLQFTHVSQPMTTVSPNPIYDGRVLSCWQRIDVSEIKTLVISADVDLFEKDLVSNTTGSGNATSFSSSVPDGKVVVGIQTSPGEQNTKTKGTPQQISNNPNHLSKNLNNPDIGFLEFTVDGTQELDIDVTNYNEVYFIINSTVAVDTEETKGDGVAATIVNDPAAVIPTQWQFVNKINSVSCKSGEPIERLMPRDVVTNDSSTWQSYKSNNPAENVITEYDYDDPRFNNLNKGQRFGLQPEQAQINGSFYIDNLQGYINFSSNISGKTVVLDYISDSLGTDGEMQVHKFAEEAMYKHMLCDIMSTRLGVPEYAINRYKKEKRASKRNAKLRLSNIKLEQIIQTFRNKSKIIK